MIEVPFPGNPWVHGLFVAFGLVAAGVVFAREKRRLGLHDDRLWAVAGCALAFGALGARLCTWFSDPTIPLWDWWTEGNRSILSGLLGAWVGVHVGKRATGYVPSTGDLFAPAVALAMAIGRLGCALTELPGTPTGGPWGMTLPSPYAEAVGARPGVGLHPSLLYEVAFHAVAFAVLWRLRGRLARPGDLFVSYVAAYALFRFAVEFVRGNEPFWLGLSGPQVLCLILLPLLVWRLTRVIRDALALRRARICRTVARTGGE